MEQPMNISFIYRNILEEKQIDKVVSNLEVNNFYLM